MKKRTEVLAPTYAILVLMGVLALVAFGLMLTAAILKYKLTGDPWYIVIWLVSFLIGVAAVWRPVKMLCGLYQTAKEKDRRDFPN